MIGPPLRPIRQFVLADRVLRFAPSKAPRSRCIAVEIWHDLEAWRSRPEHRAESTQDPAQKGLTDARPRNGGEPTAFLRPR